MGEKEGSVEAIRAIAEEALALFDEVPAKLAKGKLDTDYKLVCLMMLVFARDLFRSLLWLERSRSVVPVNVLARTLFETMVNLLYITTDRLKLSERFLSYEYAEAYASLLSRKKWGEAVNRHVERKITQRWQGVSHIHGRKNDPTKPGEKWHACTFHDIFQRAAQEYPALKKEYDAYYRPDSALAHASVAALRRYVEKGAGGGFTIRPDGPHPQRFDVLWGSAQNFLAIFGAVEDALSLGVGPRLSALQKRVKSVVQSARAQ